MKYFIDSEFIEGFHKPLFGKRRHFIDLISISIEADDGRHYNAISSEYNYNDAGDWVKQNVITPLFTRQAPIDKQHSDVCNFHKLVGKKNKQIAKEIIDFVNPGFGFHTSAYSNSELREGGILYPKFEAHNVTIVDNHYVAQPEFYGYYADYDWVLLCSLFGTMEDLPPGFPMFCYDLQQMFEEAAKRYQLRQVGALLTMDACRNYLKSDKKYPEQSNEHLSEYDAKWDKALYYYLINK